MNEKFESPKNKGPEHQETLQQKIERLRPAFQKSLEIYQDPERRLEDGALTVTRRLPDGGIETLPLLVTVGINEDGPDLAGIDENGDPTESPTMLWKEIIEVK